MAIVSPEDLGARILEIRERRHYSQEELAEKSGVAADTIRRIERGRYGPSFKTLVKIAVGLDLTVGELLRDELDQASELAALIRRLPPVHKQVAFALLGALHIDSLT